MDVSFKKSLYEHCLSQIDEKITMANSALMDVAETAEDATKSSAGDKYETTVAMMQLERDKYEERLQEALRQKKLMQQIKPDKSFESVQFGSLVMTNLGAFFIATSLGVISISNQKVFVVSLNSPIGQALQGQKPGVELVFNGKPLKISDIF